MASVFLKQQLRETLETDEHLSIACLQQKQERDEHFKSAIPDHFKYYAYKIIEIIIHKQFFTYRIRWGQDDNHADVAGLSFKFTNLQQGLEG